MSKPAAIEMIANRAVTVTTINGYTIRFRKDEVKSVPYRAVADCMAVGIVPAEGKEYAPEEKEKQRAPTNSDREIELRDAIDKLIERNERNDFTGAGRPDIRALTGLLGWRPDKVEVESLWKTIREERGSAEE